MSPRQLGTSLCGVFESHAAPLFKKWNDFFLFYGHDDVSSVALLGVVGQHRHIQCVHYTSVTVLACAGHQVSLQTSSNSSSQGLTAPRFSWKWLCSCCQTASGHTEYMVELVTTLSGHQDSWELCFVGPGGTAIQKQKPFILYLRTIRSGISCPCTIARSCRGASPHSSWSWHFSDCADMCGARGFTADKLEQFVKRPCRSPLFASCPFRWHCSDCQTASSRTEYMV